MRDYYHFEKNAPAPKNAHFELPAGPGFGIEFDESKVEKQEQVKWS
jgi:L-alanine-DL-glutamate epimerase-like enolase superfamily enzyme